MQIAKILSFDALGIVRTYDELRKLPLHWGCVEIVLNVQMLEFQEASQGSGKQRELLSDFG
ncbi:hypothetical protein N9Z22_01060 [bacterium]|nr:hypothetical protein [bacterium]